MYYVLLAHSGEKTNCITAMLILMPSAAQYYYVLGSYLKT